MNLFIKYIFCFFVLLSIGCTKEGAADGAAAGTGKGGSLARFTISGNNLYLADYMTLEVYDLTDPKNPVKQNSINVNFWVETIFPYKDKLFVGSTDGMFIYSIADPNKPVLLGSARHVRSCDPVVANDTTAYVTLRGGSPCGPAEDGLYTYNVTDITKPVQRSLLRLSNPYGLGLKDTVVFVCRGTSGLTAVNVKNSADPKQMYTLNDGTYYDVIPYDNLLICYVSSGLILYDMSNLNKLEKLGSFQY